MHEQNTLSMLSRVFDARVFKSLVLLSYEALLGRTHHSLAHVHEQNALSVPSRIFDARIFKITRAVPVVLGSSRGQTCHVLAHAHGTFSVLSRVFDARVFKSLVPCSCEALVGRTRHVLAHVHAPPRRLGQLPGIVQDKGPCARYRRRLRMYGSALCRTEKLRRVF